MLGVDLIDLAIVLFIFFLAGAVKGVLGFGLPLITMSLMPFFIPVELAIVLSAIVQPATNINQLITSGGVREAFNSTWTILLALIPSVALGAYFLTAIEGNSHMLILGITLICFSLYTISGHAFAIARDKQNTIGSVTGLVAGVIGSLTSINGVFFIMYLVGIGASRQAFRSAIALLFIVSGVLISSGFWYANLLDKNNLILGMLALIPCFIGMWVGNKIGELIPNEAFRKLILSALLVIGAIFVFRGL